MITYRTISDTVMILTLYQSVIWICVLDLEIPGQQIKVSFSKVWIPAMVTLQDL